MLFAFTAVAHADPAESTKRAAELYDQGRKHFDLGEYKEAIASWKQAYMLSTAPLLLFNIGQAYRLSGNCAQANRFYLNYQRAEPRPTNKAELDAAMTKCKGVEPATSDTSDPPPPATATMAAAGQESRAATTEQGVDQEASPPADARRDQPPMAATPASQSPPALLPVSDAGRGLRLTGAISAGVGVVALGAGTVFAFQARNAANTVGGSPQGTPWSTVAADDERGQDAALRARIAFGVGAAAVLGGGVLWFLGHRKAAGSLDVALMPGRTEVIVSCAF